MNQAELCHATCLIVEGHGILLSGRSGSGKSDLALRLIDRGAKLVSDDYTVLEVRQGKLIATAPQNIAGKMEVRGIGVIDCAYEKEAVIRLLVILDEEAERMPEEEGQSKMIADVSVPFIKLKALEPSAPIKVELASRCFGAGAPLP